jgi:hypothetical protein
VQHGVLRKSRGDVGECTEPIQIAGSQPARAAGVERQDHVEVLILRELARHQARAPGARFPVDAMQRVAGPILAQLEQLRTRAARSPGQPAGLGARDALRVGAQQVRCDRNACLLRDAPGPKREAEAARGRARESRAAGPAEVFRTTTSGVVAVSFRA